MHVVCRVPEFAAITIHNILIRSDIQSDTELEGYTKKHKKLNMYTWGYLSLQRYVAE